MSVAFRRESDDEHKEPRFELPIPPGPNLVRESGLRRIEETVAALEALPARDEAQARELRYWRTRLATAQVAPAPPAHEAAFGSTVRFRLDGKERRVTIVGDDEADPAAGLLAFSAPLARALIGAGEGDTAAFAGREDAIEVIAIE
jgi:transcription elongation GreA/GreB family factor